VQENLAHGGEPDTFLAAIEQPGTDQKLELLQAFGNGGLGDRQLLGGAADMALAGDLEKACQMAELDAGVEQGRDSSLGRAVMSPWL
jgi:hypothetical protein